MWIIDTPLRRDGGYEDNEEPICGVKAADWVCWLRRDRTHLLIRFGREGIDRDAAEEIVRRALEGLNA